ncbi:MAG: hypothetical protein PGN16_08990 [Sphingomonas phyllosphaerae]
MRTLKMTAGYNFSTRRRFATLAGLVVASWGVIAVTIDAMVHLTR